MAGRIPSELSSRSDMGHVFNVNGHIIPGSDDRVFDMLERLNPSSPFDQGFLGAFADDAPRKIPVAVLDGLFHLTHGDSVIFQHLGSEKDLILFNKSAHIDNKRHAGNALQPVTDRPVGYRPEGHWIDLFSYDGELEYFAHPR